MGWCYLEGEGVHPAGIDDRVHPHLLPVLAALAGAHTEQTQEEGPVLANLQGV